MFHTTIRGKISYIHETSGETGREWFALTIQPNGTKTIRAHCEMDDDAILRDVVWTLGPDGRPIDAYLRLCVDGKLQGMAFFVFSPNRAECTTTTTNGERIHQSLDLTKPVEIFGAHPVSGDGMKTSLFNLAGPKLQSFSAISSSDLPNGASGPIMLQ